MSIESQGGGLVGPARIGPVTDSKTGSTVYCGDKEFQSLKGSGFKSNDFNVAPGAHHRISGPRQDGADALYPINIPTEIAEDVREEYWTLLRLKPDLNTRKHA